MMNPTFRTTFDIPKATITVSHSDQIMTIGSCFADNIAQYMQKGRFHIEINPFGILYNPISIAGALELLIDHAPLPQESIVQQGELWHSFLFHGKYAALSEVDLIAALEKRIYFLRKQIKKTTRLVVTLGTANVYIYKATQKIVANCHKIPNSAFDKKRLNSNECVTALSSVFEKLKASIPNIEIVLTISPIRHIRDGMVENQISKSILCVSAAALCEEYDYVHYFPAYELMMDDLRDYRFYEADLIHPNEQAIAYIWNHFKATFFSESTQKVLDEVHKLWLLQQHRPLFPESMAYQRFMEQRKVLEAQLKTAYPFLYWDNTNNNNEND